MAVSLAGWCDVTLNAARVNEGVGALGLRLTGWVHPHSLSHSQQGNVLPDMQVESTGHRVAETAVTQPRTPLCQGETRMASF